MSQDIKSRKRISLAVLSADTVKATGIRTLGAHYRPARAEFSSSAIEASDADVFAARDAERVAQVVLDAARDRSRIAEHTRHDLLVGATEQVAAQFGKNSDEYQGLGLKKKAEYGK